MVEDFPLKEFKDFPIEFMEVNPEDFPNFIIKGDKKEIITLKDGYIDDSLKEIVDIKERNTVVVNCAVGQGKTSAILDLIENYDLAEYQIFIVSPFVSLVQQYYEDLIKKGINENLIYRYEKIANIFIAEIGDKPNYKPIHIITTNSLLGNPGEDYFRNGDTKREYIDTMTSTLKVLNKKCIFIYDEIHDSYYNFKEEFMFYLWKWEGIIHKNYVLSATFNEASKVVIQYLAELTDNKIQIIESERNKNDKIQSSLYLHYLKPQNYDFENDTISNVITTYVEYGYDIDILSYSKSKCETLDDKKSELGNYLKGKFNGIRLCVSDQYSLKVVENEKPSNRFDNDFCNVGTNFKSGINILKDKHAFFIVIPPRGAGSNGIFSDGINSVIQAIARQRKAGDIHIFLPNPKQLNYESLPFKKNPLQYSKFIDVYEKLADKAYDYIAEYLPISLQASYLKDFYNEELYGYLENEINTVKSKDRTGRVRLEYPTLEIFKLNKGEYFLAKTHDFWGKDLSTFITYSALTNQFYNCELKGIYGNNIILFEENKVQEKLEEYCNSYMNIDNFNSLYSKLSDEMYLLEFRKDLFKNYTVLYKTGNAIINITEGKKKEFELQLLAFIQRKLYPFSSFFQHKYYKDGRIVDYDITRSEYLRCKMAHIKEYSETVPAYKELVKVYKILKMYKERLLMSAKDYKGKKVIPRVPDSNFFNNNDIKTIGYMANVIVFNDTYLRDNFYNYRKYLTTYKDEKIFKTFYKYLVDDFLECRDDKITTGLKKRKDVYEIINVLYTPDPKEVINMINVGIFNDEFDAVYPLETHKELLSKAKNDISSKTDDTDISNYKRKTKVVKK